MADPKLSEEGARVYHRLLLATLGYSHSACVEALEAALKVIKEQAGMSKEKNA